LEGCLTAYAARLKTGASPKDVVFMGESAGGTLVLSLALLLKEKGFPQPKRWCLSPPV
jgi:alpha/beta hydrolase family protein